MPLKPSLNIAWIQPAVLADIPSPSLVLGLDPIRANLNKMLALAGGPARLRPHVKTHKLPQLVRMQLDLGITRFKCATIAEAEMCARAGVPDMLIAYPMVGPNVRRLIALQQKYPGTTFSSVADNLASLQTLARAAEQAGVKLEVLLDLDIGQHRTGIPAGPAAVELYRQLAKMPSLIAGGLHAYDGHLSQPDPAERSAACGEAMKPVRAMMQELKGLGLAVPRLVAGGSPTFPFHAGSGDCECSPGVVVLWDSSSVIGQPDLDFETAALVLTRVVSKPADDLICLDLGHKAVGSEMPHPRVLFPELPGAEAVKHSEEHLLLRTPLARKFAVGDALLGVPWHICPAVALHAEAVIVEGGRVTGSWPVEARARRITV